MPLYGSAATPTTRGITMLTRVVPAFSAPNGYNLLSTCPTGRRWKIETIWLRNSDPTQTMRVSLQMVPGNWIGAVSDANLIVFRELLVKPKDHVLVDGVLGMGPRSALWAYQIDDAGTGALGVTMLVAGEESG